MTPLEKGSTSNQLIRRLVRVVEGARLESVYTSKGYQGFESLSLRLRPPKLQRI